MVFFFSFKLSLMIPSEGTQTSLESTEKKKSNKLKKRRESNCRGTGYETTQTVTNNKGHPSESANTGAYLQIHDALYLRKQKQ